MKRILVPCNFSSYAEKAFRFALELAEKNQGSIFVCTIISEPEAIATKTSMTEDQAREKYAYFIQNFDIQHVPVTHHVHTGKITTAVLELIARYNLDLVVMGTQGSRGWQEAFMGSNIGKVVRTCPIPVIAVKNDTTISKIRNIVFPCGMQHEDENLVSHVKTLQLFFDARLHLLYVNTHPRRDSQQGMQQLQKLASEHQLHHYNTHVVHSAIEKDGILQFAREINADLIAMGTHGNRNPGNMYISSIAADIVNYAPIMTWTCAMEKSE
ncbi:MAG TPA: universal stress protein [Dyadobacter sp.]|jgi:nucleotide-binding universal stress UspA family protein|nr:universal stress protein [Dyadobacter sp.]